MFCTSNNLHKLSYDTDAPNMPVHVIKQVKGIQIMGPQDHDSASELEHIEMPAGGEDPYGGPREWVLRWFGPFYDTQLPRDRNAGLYLIYVGNYPIYVGASANIFFVLSHKIIFNNRQTIPIDMLGREIAHQANVYRQPLSLKVALLYEDGKLIPPDGALHCYKRASDALAHCNRLVCNQEERLGYPHDPVSITCEGKYFPIKRTFRAGGA